MPILVDGSTTNLKRRKAESCSPSANKRLLIASVHPILSQSCGFYSAHDYKIQVLRTAFIHGVSENLYSLRCEGIIPSEHRINRNAYQHVTGGNRILPASFPFGTICSGSTARRIRQLSRPLPPGPGDRRDKRDGAKRLGSSGG